MYGQVSRDEEMPYELWLCSIPDLGAANIRRLIEVMGGAQAVYSADADSLGQVLSQRKTEKVQWFAAQFKLREEYERMLEKGISLVTMKDDAYPSRLRRIPDPPYGLFYMGKLPGEGPAVAVVGARECSAYGSYVAKKLGEVLARNGVCVVSGMARGVDGISQQAALEAGGNSCGVLGCGVDVCYPRENSRLYERLRRDGCLLSSYPIGTAAAARNFPPRNRIVSGMADAVVVVEAREKSGTLITVDMALEQGREVYVTPGRITDSLSRGCNRLIRQGAVPLLDPEEMLVELYGKNITHVTEPGGDDTGLSHELLAVQKALEFTPSTAEDIRKRLPQELRTINISSCLMRLCMEGRAVQAGAGSFCRKI